jgi:hypothetical protein
MAISKSSHSWLDGLFGSCRLIAIASLLEQLLDRRHIAGATGIAPDSDDFE